MKVAKGTAGTAAGGMAKRVGVRRGAAAGDAPFFNGLHLRVEPDAAAWIATAGGQQRFWDRCAMPLGEYRPQFTLFAV